MTNLAIWLERAGKGDPQRPALGLGTRVLRSYGEVAERVARLAGALRAMGLTPGDRVAIAATNSPDYLEILYAIWHAGLAAVPANAKLHGAELGYILDHSEARVCFASEQLRADIAAHAPKSLERLFAIGSAEYERLFQADAIGAASVGPNDLAWLFYTSGTTGRSCRRCRTAKRDRSDRPMQRRSRRLETASRIPRCRSRRAVPDSSARVPRCPHGAVRKRNKPALRNDRGCSPTPRREAWRSPAPRLDLRARWHRGFRDSPGCWWRRSPRDRRA